MSSSDTESTDRDEKMSSNLNKFKAKDIAEVKILGNEDLYDYIEILHRVLKRQEMKLTKYKNKICELNQETNILKCRQKGYTSELRTEHHAEIKDITLLASKEKTEALSNNRITAQDAFSFVDEMRHAAEQAQNISNFIYEPTSGLYYDQKSGYYYNAEHALYYDGNTGCYYNFNQRKNCYEFHSQVQVQAVDPAKKENVADDEVAFDEFGVVTDLEKATRLCEKKKLEKQDKEHQFKKQSSKNKSKDNHRKHEKYSYKKRKRSKKQNKYIENDSESEKNDTEGSEDFEDGELTTSSSSSGVDSKSEAEAEKRKAPIFKGGGRFQDVAKKFPPSLRIVVQETNLEDLKVGSLSLITFKGGSLGREGNHDVIIPDVNVSKFHLKFSYDTQQSIYKCVDLGSRNGTILNGFRMSASKTESDSYNLVHGSVIQISQTKLLCHVHEGSSTCGLCEPGLLIEPQQQKIVSGSALSHKEQLKKIQKKYGLENEKFVTTKQNAGNNSTAAGKSIASCTSKNNINTYKDRAATRRLKFGSSTDREKTQTASMDTAISSENKGFKMLSKLGWNKGEALGKISHSSGLLEPINVESNAGHKGLGCSDPTAGLTPSCSDKKKLELITKTKERYKAADILINFYDSN